MTNEEICREIEVINQLTHEQVCRLWRFAPPGHPYFVVDGPLWPVFKARFDEFGGMTPGMSKQIGL